MLGSMRFMPRWSLTSDGKPEPFEANDSVDESATGRIGDFVNSASIFRAAEGASSERESQTLSMEVYVLNV